MPLYEYRCQECGATTEALVTIAKRDDAVCSKCGSRKLERKLSTFAVRGSSAGNDIGGSCPTGTCSFS
ncbi:MAG: zinc ribbon domain-containing protein [Vicinamibacteria bacterium]|nr:zinc ribbon domain-containing protein [Vicinamibacteria bacterium]